MTTTKAKIDDRSQTLSAKTKTSQEMRILTQADYDEISKVDWWHRIPVGHNEQGEIVYTPGQVNHGPNGGDWITLRFGLPKDLRDKSVLDIGAWDGMFSFEAEARGAEQVKAVDIVREVGGNWGGTDGFRLAKTLLSSGVEYAEYDIQAKPEKYGLRQGWDVVLCYGVLYHLMNPFTAIQNLFDLTSKNGICLIETAAIPPSRDPGYPAWADWTGHDNDLTNTFYPNLEALTRALLRVGFKNVFLVASVENGIRITVQAERKD
jgi:tRNA (mo5U34)-methyltransferase